MARQTRRQRRERLWRHLFITHGKVACWVCGKHVPRAEATLEHKRPKACGGTNAWTNLAISHGPCNHRRGHRLLAHRALPIG